MKSKLFYLLLLLLVLAACRTDYLPNEHQNNQITKSALVSKVISLNESVHKNKISPLPSQMKKSYKSIAHGKTINFGDSITIDTDQVIYIEYKAYHTYTFNIERNNKEPNAPVENLILSLEPDGSYREIINTYNISENEKDQILEDKYVDLKSKISSQELEKEHFCKIAN